MSGDFQVKVNSITQKQWETKHFGYLVEQAEVDLIPKQKRLIYTLVDVKNIKLIQQLEEEGYRYLVSTIELKLEQPIQNQYKSYGFRDARDEDLEQLKLIAETSFDISRLHSSTDPHIADLMHGEWIENCLNKTQADHVYVYEYQDKIQGFIAVRTRDRIGQIVLIAVRESSRGLGIGRGLICHACEEMRKDVDSVEVRTELSNFSAIRMYERCRFRITKSGVYLGKWTE